MQRARMLLGPVLAGVLFGALAAVLPLRDQSEDDLGLAASSTRGRAIRMQIPESLGPYGKVTRKTISASPTRSGR